MAETVSPGTKTDDSLPDSGEKRILIFEDSDIFADMLIEFLENAGYTVGRAVNGLEGIKQVYQFFPRLIITDVEMPLFKGYQATRLLKSRKTTKNIPVIMFTTLSEKRDKFWGGQAGADSYFEKAPENFEKLRLAIEAFLAENRVIDYAAIKKEGRRIDNDSLIETVNNLLDNKLFQTTIIGMLAELSKKLNSLPDIVNGFFDLLSSVCEAEIAALMIKTADNSLFVFTANRSGYTQEIADDFNAIASADFAGLFPEFKVLHKDVQDFFPAGEKSKRLESYFMLPLSSGGENFATVHIGASIKEYFSPAVTETLNVFLEAAAPIIANALSLLQIEELQKRTRAAFARYVPLDVMDEIIKKSAASSSTSETRNIAILFSDIRNFTKISEKTNAQDLVTFLNAYFSLMGNEVVSEGGNVDKFIGDAIMAIFGAPKTLDNAAASAIRTALKMVRGLSKVDTSLITLPETGFAAGIGINYGECVVGNIGFQDKLDYTVIGDAVNLASRLEGVTKMYHHPIIVSENMYAAAKDEFIFRKVDSVRVKGKNLPVGIYAVYGAYHDGDTEGLPASLILNRSLFDNYNKGLKLYAMREWDTAKQYFNEALKIDPADYLAGLYLEQIAINIANPPPDDWDGTTTLTEK